MEGQRQKKPLSFHFTEQRDEKREKFEIFMDGKIITLNAKRNI
jgi:hypothetical protein